MPCEDTIERYSAAALESAQLAAIVSSSDDAIVSKTLDGIVTSWHAGATNILGYEADEMIGQPITRIIPPELHQEEKQILVRLHRGERIQHY
jgi:PAS domain S-box-containing protein